MLPIIKRAAKIASAGNIATFADAIGAPRSALYVWQDIPPRYVLRIEEVTDGILTAHEMRPDLYTEAMSKPKKAKGDKNVPARKASA